MLVYLKPNVNHEGDLAIVILKVTIEECRKFISLAALARRCHSLAWLKRAS